MNILHIHLFIRNSEEWGATLQHKYNTWMSKQAKNSLTGARQPSVAPLLSPLRPPALCCLLLHALPPLFFSNVIQESMMPWCQQNVSSSVRPDYWPSSYPACTVLCLLLFRKHLFSRIYSRIWSLTWYIPKCQAIRSEQLHPLCLHTNFYCIIKNTYLDFLS